MANSFAMSVVYNCISFGHRVLENLICGSFFNFRLQLDNNHQYSQTRMKILQKYL